LQARKDNDTQSAKDAATAKQETIKNNSGASLVFADPSKGGSLNSPQTQMERVH